MNIEFMNNGFIDKLAKIEEGVVIFPNVFIYGKSVIKKGAIVYPNSLIFESIIGENCEIKSSYIENSEIQNNAKVGPFAHIRPNSVIGENCKIGNFVEIKNSILKKGTKASHLAYIGDAEIGENCNIGCGVIFANYDGTEKHRTIVGNNCFIGSNCNIIAPLNVANNSYICAGTTLTKNTQEDDFIIGRQRERIISKRAHKYLRGL